MRPFKCISLLLSVYVLIGIVSPVFAQAVKKEWYGNLGNGEEIKHVNLASIIEQHERWLRTEGRKGARANLQGANLRGCPSQKLIRGKYIVIHHLLCSD